MFSFKYLVALPLLGSTLISSVLAGSAYGTGYAELERREIDNNYNIAARELTSTIVRRANGNQDLAREILARALDSIDGDLEARSLAALTSLLGGGKKKDKDHHKDKEHKDSKEHKEDH